MSTPLINWSNVTDLSQIPAQANAATGGDFWLFMLFMLWVVGIFLFSAISWEIALMTSSFICLVLGLFLVYMQLVAWSYLMIFVAVLILTFLYVNWVTNKSR